MVRIINRGHVIIFNFCLYHSVMEIAGLGTMKLLNMNKNENDESTSIYYTKIVLARLYLREFSVGLI